MGQNVSWNPRWYSETKFKYPLLLIIDILIKSTDQRNLGMSMKIERSTLEQVKARFAQNKKKLEEKKKDYDLEQRVKELKEEVRFFILETTWRL